MKKEAINTIDLSNLPKWKNGVNEGCVNWNETIGYFVKGTYHNINFEVEIIKYSKDKKELIIKYKNKEHKIHIKSFINCCFGYVLNIKTKEFKYDIGHVFKDDKRDITIIDRKRIQRKNGQWVKCYKYKCNQCGFDCDEHYNSKDKEYKEELWVSESNIKKQGCACCCVSSHIVVENINSIYHTDKWMIPYIGEDNAKIHACNSHDRLYMVCPDCGRTKRTKLSINTLYANHSIGCSCSDSQPYGEKLMFSILEQLKLDFQTQLSKTTFEWCDKYRYDFYFEYNDEQYIIETHGKQHYEDATKLSVFDKLIIQQKNDKIKKDLAIKNGIKPENYIVIDCRKSDLEWIRNNEDGVLNSRLNELFDLSKIDWIKANNFTLCNFVKIICKYKKDNPDKTTTEIGKIFNIDTQLIRIYLRKGSKIWDWCNYNGKEEQRKVVSKNGKKRGKKVRVFKNGIDVGTYNSTREVAREIEKIFGINFDNSNVSAICLGKRKEYKGYTFEYV